MITNKDIRVENGNLVLNGDKYPLDGQSPEAIMQIVEDNSDTTPTANSSAPVTSAGIKTYVDGKIFVKGQAIGTSLVVNANSFARAEIPCAESGYTALGVISVQGAALAGAVTIMEFGLSADATKVYVYLANNTNAKITIPDVRVRVLYTKN